MMTQRKRLFFGIVTILFILSIPYMARATGTVTNLQIGDVCTNGTQCSTDTCEQKAGTNISYCVCNATAGKEAEGAQQCAAKYAGTNWECEQGIGGSYNLNYCQDPQNKDRSIAPAGTTGGSSWWEYITDTTAAVQFDAEELNKLLKKPSLKINIPGVTFSDPNSLVKRQEADGTYVYFPYLGEYIAGIYKYGIIAIAVLSIIMIIVAGFIWVTSAGSSDRINAAKKRITQAIIGLFLAVSSYTLLFTINPELVNFRNLRVRVVETEPLPTAGSNDEDPKYDVSPSEANQPPPAGAKATRNFTVDDPQNFCFPISDGFDRSKNNWGQARERYDKLTLCHQGLDLYTFGKENRGTIVSMTGGVVRRVTEKFYKCSDGKSDNSNSGEEAYVGMIEIYDKAHGMTYVYGEVNTDSIQVKKDQVITKGQVLAKASKCMMLHLEVYEGARMNRGTVPSPVLKNKVDANWWIYDSLNLPPLKSGLHACLVSPYIDILDQTNSKLLNPTNLIEQIKNNQC